MQSKLSLRTETAGDAVTIYCAGRLTLEHAGELRDTAKAAMAGKKELTIDLGGVTQMDSSGLGALVSIYISARRDGWTLQLLNASDAIRKLLSLSNLLSLFEACGKARMA
jgi:anti-anti-sigma factor